MPCPGPQLIGAFLDGELDAANIALAEGHFARCEPCRRELQRLERLRSALRASGVGHKTPVELQRKIEWLVARSSKERAARHNVVRWLAPGLTGAVAASLAILGIIAPAAQQTALDDQLLSSHVRSLQQGHLLDVDTSSQHVVKPWFNGRIDFSPAVPELAAAGFPLAGGRLDSVDGKSAAAIVYRRRLHVVNLFVWRSKARGTREFRRDGFTGVEWSRDGLEFAALSDIAPDELERFRRLYESRST